ncbi:uncharacterized protein RSE6_07424 [Rhynchosporium secalis]|uniref:Uncharacterized protein n=1 Tax=Rhynchosporium secalis TaxID=38038 RepID=A0A1E1MDX3_RHYSE|nr:uncharacterized protein RSE6_07424 [Rhynchosporium secalis]
MSGLHTATTRPEKEIEGLKPESWFWCSYSQETLRVPSSDTRLGSSLRMSDCKLIRAILMVYAVLGTTPSEELRSPGEPWKDCIVLRHQKIHGDIAKSCTADVIYEKAEPAYWRRAR